MPVSFDAGIVRSDNTQPLNLWILMNKRTALYQQHLDSNAKIVDFSGWDMPIHYGSQLAEHRQVREECGVFDVSHMTVVDVDGPEAEKYLRYLLCNDVAKLDESGKALYSGMLDYKGGVIDDLIVYSMQEGFRLVVNCGTREKDLEWMTVQAKSFDVWVLERPELSILAIHGPSSIDKVCSVLAQEDAEAVRALPNFKGVMCGEWFIARTGYTGEKGLELIFPQELAPAFWEKLLSVGVKPIGLGARDTLRLEAGMNLYGQDMDESVSPLAANMEFAVSWLPLTRDFIGREALTNLKQKQLTGDLPVLCGLVMEERGVLRHGQRVITDNGEGFITSGSFSPTLNMSVALARVPAGSRSAQVEIRDKLVPVIIGKPGFVRFGKKVFQPFSE